MNHNMRVISVVIFLLGCWLQFAYSDPATVGTTVYSNAGKIRDKKAPVATDADDGKVLAYNKASSSYKLKPNSATPGFGDVTGSPDDNSALRARFGRGSTAFQSKIDGKQNALGRYSCAGSGFARKFDALHGTWYCATPDGTRDHAVLVNLDYAHARHTGFQATLNNYSCAGSGYMKKYVNGSWVCSTPYGTGGGVADQSCPSGKVVKSIASGVFGCVSSSSGGGGSSIRLENISSQLAVTPLAHPNIIPGEGLYLKEDKANDAWYMGVNRTRGIYGPRYPKGASKLGIETQGAATMSFVYMNYSTWGSYPTYGGTGYSAMQRSLKRIELTYARMNEMGVKNVHIHSFPVKLAGYPTGTVPTQTDLAQYCDWSAVDREMQLARQYGMRARLYNYYPTMPDINTWKAANNTTDFTTTTYIAICLAYAEFLSKRYASYGDILTVDPQGEFLLKRRVTDWNSALDTYGFGVDPRWIALQEGVYDFWHANCPGVTVTPPSVANSGSWISSLTLANPWVLIEQLVAAGKRAKFDDEIDIHLYPIYADMEAPDWYSTSTMTVHDGGTATIQGFRDYLDSHNMSNVKIGSGEFSYMFGGTGYFSFTNGSNHVVATDSLIAKEWDTGHNPPLRNGQQIQILPDPASGVTVPSTVYTISNVTDIGVTPAGFDISPAYSGPNLDRYTIINLTERQNAVDSLTQLTAWINSKDWFTRAERYCFWDGDQVPSQPNYNAYDQALIWPGIGLVGEYSGQENPVGTAFRTLNNGDFNKDFTKVLTASGASSDLPTWAEFGLLFAETDGYKRLFMGQGNSTDRKRIDTPFVVSDDNTKVGLNTSSPGGQLHLHSSTSYGAGSALFSSGDNIILTTENNSVTINGGVADSSATSGYRATFRGSRSRGTLESPTVPVTDDQVVSLLGAVYTGRVLWNAGDITMKVDGTVSDSGTNASILSPLRITFSTRPAGTTWYERMAIKSDGKVVVGDSASYTASELLNVRGNINLDSGYCIKYNGTCISTSGSSNTITQGNSSVAVTDAGTGYIRLNVDGHDTVHVVNGKLHINSTGAPTHELDVWGDIGLTKSTSQLCFYDGSCISTAPVSSIATANGFAGSVSSSVATITTTVTGVLKGNGGSVSAAVVDTDYISPNSTIRGRRF